MPDETSKPKPKSFSLRALTKAEIQKLQQEKREAIARDRDAKRPHPTALRFFDRGSNQQIQGGYLETLGWVLYDELSNDEFVTLRRMLGPQIPREQKILTRGFDPERLRDLEAFLAEEMKAGSETVQLRFVDPFEE